MAKHCSKPSTRRARRAVAHALLGRVLAGTLALLLTSTAAVVAVLDQDRARGPVLEREHDPSSCAWFHNHTICRLTSSNPSQHAGRVMAPLWTAAVECLRWASAAGPESGDRRLTYFSRAPPT